METDTKAMSFKEILDKVAHDDYEQEYCTIKDFDALHRNYSWQDVKNCIDKAAELYKDSCLAAQKVEHERDLEQCLNDMDLIRDSVTQEKAKAFDDMTEIEKENLGLFVNRMLNMATNMGHEYSCKRTIELLKSSGFQLNPYRQDK